VGCETDRGNVRPFDKDGRFQAGRELNDLRRTAVRGAGVSVLSQAAVFGTQIISTLILARILTPGDFGLVAMVTTFSMVLMSFGQNGFSQAVMQREELSEALASNLFWLNFVISAVLTVLFAATGPLIARFYKDPLLTKITIVLALTIFLNNVCMIHIALLKRALKFSATSANEIVCGVASVTVSVILAFAGWGYWALAIGALVKPLVLALGAFFLCHWMPKPPSRNQDTRSILGFATNLYGRFSFNYATRNTDNLIVGWRFGPTSLGFYKKAYDLFVMPANQLIIPVADVVLSTLGRLKSGSEEYKNYFLNGLSILTFAGMAVGGILTLSGKDLIRVMLGPKWAPAGEIFTFFGPGVGIMLIYTTSGLLHLSIGRADRWFKWVGVEFVVTVLLFIVGARWGAVGVASAWTASFTILLLPAFWYAGHPIKLGIGPIVATIWRYVLAALLAGVAAAFIFAQIGMHNELPGTVIAAIQRIIVMCALYLALYLAAIVVFYGGPQPLYRFARLVPDLLPWNRARRAVATAPSDLKADAV